MQQYGHSRIGLITGKPHLFTSQQRIEGFLATMRGAGLEVDPSLIVNGNYDDDEAYVATMRLLTRGDRPTAIVVSANLMALAALQAIQDLGFRRPEDVSLASDRRGTVGHAIRRAHLRGAGSDQTGYARGGSADGAHQRSGDPGGRGDRSHLAAAIQDGRFVWPAG